MAQKASAPSSKIKSTHTTKTLLLPGCVSFTLRYFKTNYTESHRKHNANQTTCCRDQKAIWAKIQFEHLFMSLNSCCFNGMINGTIRRQIEPHTFGLLLLCSGCLFMLLCEHELAWNVAFLCLPMWGKYQCDAVYSQGMEELICNISFKTCLWTSRKSHASPSLL